LCDALALKRLGNTPTSVSGIVKHLTLVERWWFRRIFDGQEWMPSTSVEIPDSEFVILAGESLEK